MHKIHRRIPLHANCTLRFRSSMVIAYLREQLCLVQRGVSTDKAPENPIWPGIDISQNLPRVSGPEDISSSFSTLKTVVNLSYLLFV